MAKTVRNANEVKELLTKNKLKATEFYDDNLAFFAPGIKMNGVEMVKYQHREKTVWAKFHVLGKPNGIRYQENLRLFNEITEEVAGAFCPFCAAQGFRTDMDGIACCGACPGWFFFYTYEHDEEAGKTKYQIINGKLVEVPYKALGRDKK